MSIEIEQVKIADRVIDRIQDEEGIYWYPLRSFFLRILLKKEATREFRDSKLIKYMKVFEYQPYRSGSRTKAWCMNENGIKYVLRNISVGNGKSETINELRRKNLSEACLYFGIDRTQELSPEYMYITPKLKDYDIWSLTCIMNDQDLHTASKWKRCKECKYYYPCSNKYFTRYRGGRYNTKCKTCEGSVFKCDNKILQYIYEHDGLDLIYAISTYDNDKIAKQLDIFINKGGAFRYDDKRS